MLVGYTSFWDFTIEHHSFHQTLFRGFYFLKEEFDKHICSYGLTQVYVRRILLLLWRIQCSIQHLPSVFFCTFLKSGRYFLQIYVLYF